jgi:asparagine synthase (glutamine-hydrolysing)
MQDPSGGFGIVFNGQIYNHESLRDELIEKGYSFKTGTDTETLLYWLKENGRKGLRKLCGMYAFVFWDSSKELLIIHRDQYGIKPLFYARNRHYLVFSSEPAGLFASGLFKFSPDSKGIASYLKYKFIPSPNNAWIGMKEVMPGESIEYWEGKPMHYQVKMEIEIPDFNDLKSAINAGFKQIIPREKSVGLMLSGGIDSTIILQHCLENGIQVELFSIRFGFGSKDDFADQEAVEYLGKLFQIPKKKL